MLQQGLKAVPHFGDRGFTIEVLAFEEESFRVGTRPGNQSPERPDGPRKRDNDAGANLSLLQVDAKMRVLTFDNLDVFLAQARPFARPQERIDHKDDKVLHLGPLLGFCSP